MICEEVREYIDNLRLSKGSVLGLEAIKALLLELDNPQDKIKIVHVTGTNAKGSTVSFISNICIKSGYKVGVYSSPAVFDYYEMFRINNKNITKEDYALVGSKVIKAATKLNNNGIYPTSFEIETAIAYEYFYEQKIDIAIIEVGMGGKLDATNVTKNTMVSVITPISIDHIEYLGDTISKIAKVKAGIIKDNSYTVVSLGQDIEAINVINEIAADKNSKVVIPSSDKLIIKKKEYFDYRDITDIKIKMQGTTQIYNALTAIELALILKENYGYDNITYDTIRKGIDAVQLFGRIEKVADNPAIIIDGAHNVAAATNLREYVRDNYKDKNIIVVTGMFKDKDYTNVAKIMSLVTDNVITVTPPTDRGLDSKVLEKVYKDIYEQSDISSKVVSYDRDYAKAIDYAKTMAKEDDVILVFGSFSFLAMIKSII